jgi:hypothetical protein
MGNGENHIFSSILSNLKQIKTLLGVTVRGPRALPLSFPLKLHSKLLRHTREG